MANPSRQKSQKRVTIQHHSQQNDEEYEDDIPMSQQSMTSSDAGIMAAVAQQMQASKEKKKKEKTKKFFQLAERELDKCRYGFDQTRTKLFESFVSSYATSEDDIRKLWVLIGEEQKLLLDLAIRQHTLATSQSLEIEKGQLAGMANVKRACEDFKTLVDELTVNVH
ncbi:hypothetical protein PILCRDRAFT_766095 [Piloderma croceum F 1598]|uniref:Uncharacterized protein n=1 Tax=Piloderma croceum (strain F 1598) TaxID=765440 RepID=A0A0C3GF70_PILCF|nr:hypothetical protein PILCRDRAFT_766095 [Piloderma croceum F 1598]